MRGPRSSPDYWTWTTPPWKQRTAEALARPWTDAGGRTGILILIAAYADLGGEGTVPVEGDQGGFGTLFSHWDETTFFNELMTGFLNSSPNANPLSDVSVASMGDLGYVVNLGVG